MNSPHLGHSDLWGIGHDTRTDESSGETTNDLGDQVDIPGPSDNLEYSGLIGQLYPTVWPWNWLTRVINAVKVYMFAFKPNLFAVNGERNWKMTWETKLIALHKPTYW
jgi:hypothetical protein